MSSLTVRGVVSVEGSEFPVGGVTVIARMPAAAFAAAAKDSYQGVQVQIGRVDTDSDGSFEIETDENDEAIARYACLLRSCDDFRFTLAAFDGDELLLHETGPLAYRDELRVEMALRAPDRQPTDEDWADLASRMIESQTARLGDIAVELATLSPHRVFAGWSVTRRLAVLGQLEQALLDPTNVFGNSGIPLRFAQLTDETAVMNLREQLRRDERMDLLQALDVSVARARQAGSLREVDLFGDPELFRRGDYLAAANAFVEIDVRPGFFGWLDSPTVGYRDYLRDRWIDNQRIEPVLGGPNQEVATRTTMIRRLNHRFHQNFNTQDVTELPANRVLIPILLTMLQAPTGNGYGFGVAAAAIAPQNARSDRDYLDYLISLTRLKVAEVEKRYRVNLQRSDFEVSSAVQQNIDTLQRFFTDSYQSVEDPFEIKPDRKAGTNELLIAKFPLEGAGPFFLEYEEWLEREAPFYPENHYDPRATYQWNIWERLQKTREMVFANSMPVGSFIETAKSGGKFDPLSGAYNHAASKWQWVRNHIELWDLIVAGHNDLKSLNYVAAEDKYNLALAWTIKLRDFVRGAAAWWQYDPAAFAKEQKNADVSTMAKLTEYERRYHRNFGQHYDSSTGTVTSDLLSGGGEISEYWWGKDEAPFYWHGNKREIRYLLDYLQFRYLPVCVSEVQLALGKYADAVRQLVGREGLYSQTYRWFAGPAGFNVFAATPAAGGPMGIGAKFKYFTDGSLAYASSSDRTAYPPPDPPTSLPTNRAEAGYFRLKLGNAALEWADVLYRSNQPDSIMRARELYKAVLFLHGEDPGDHAELGLDAGRCCRSSRARNRSAIRRS